MPATHNLKTIQPYFDAVVDGRKRFECRSTQDRVFCVGDTVVLQEYDLLKGLTGRESRWLIGFMVSGPQFGIEYGYSVLSLVERLPASTNHQESVK